MATKQKLVSAFISFLDREISSGLLSDEAVESIEVAKQCLQTAYQLNIELADLENLVDLEELFYNCAQEMPSSSKSKPITDEAKAQAEDMKTKGNSLMQQDLYQDAVNAYTEAIKLDPTNVIYYSNRAAAYNKLERFEEAISDCDEALILDPTYSKAYGRKGLALAALNDHHAAIACYKKAIELDPANQNLRANLELAEEKARGSSGGAGYPGGLGALFGGGGGAPDMTSFLSNPAMLNMATQLMQNPAISQMMTSMLSGQTNSQNSQGQGPQVGIDQLLRTGQQLAEQMQQSNPELIEQLRNQFGRQQPPPSGGSS